MPFSDTGLTLLIALYVGFGLLGLLFYFGRDADTKRRLWPLYNVAVGLLFLGIVWRAQTPPAFLAFIAAFVGFGVWRTLRSTRFCDGCGRMYQRGSSDGEPAFCSKCGARLTGQD